MDDAHDSDAARGEITRLLRAARGGDRAAFDELVPLVYDDLRRIARRLLRGRHQTLGATGVVHEAWAKLADHENAAYNDRGHFMAVAARAMRQVMLDYARARAAAKRGGRDAPVTLEEDAAVTDDQAVYVIAVDQALERLAAHNEQLARLVECRFFAGYSEAETAEALGVSLRTVQRGWPRARAWLKEALRGIDETDDGRGAPGAPGAGGAAR